MGSVLDTASRVLVVIVQRLQPVKPKNMVFLDQQCFSHVERAVLCPHHSRLDSPPHPLLNSSVIIPTLVIHHSFTSITLSLQAQTLPFQQIFPTVDFFYLLDCLTITGLDRTVHAHHFIFSFTLYFFVHSVW